MFDRHPSKLRERDVRFEKVLKGSKRSLQEKIVLTTSITDAFAPLNPPIDPAPLAFDPPAPKDFPAVDPSREPAPDPGQQTRELLVFM